MISMFPFIVWGLTIIAGLFIYIGVATVIEKSGLARLGATGHLFTCDPESSKKQAEN